MQRDITPSTIERVERTLENCLAEAGAGPVLLEQAAARDILDLLREMRTFLAEPLPRGPLGVRCHWLYDLAPVAFFILDADGRILRANPAALRLLGLPDGSEPPMSLERFISPEDSPSFAYHRSQVLEAGSRESMDLTISCADGSVRHVQMSSVVVAGELGDCQPGMLSTALDITERQLMEAALKQSEHRYRGIVENAPVGIFQASAKGCYLTVNPEFARIHGYSSPADMVLSVSNIGSEVFVRPERFAELLREIEAAGEVVNFESRHRRKDGGTLWVSSTTRAVCDSEGRLVSFEGFVFDITTRKEAELAKRRTEERLRAVFETAGSYILLLGPDLRILELNREAEELFGCGKGVAAGRHYLAFFRPQRQWDAASLQFSEVMAVGEAVSFELPVQNAAGRLKDVLWSATRLTDHRGRPEGIILAGQDITAKKRAETTLLLHNARLETLVKLNQMAGESTREVSGFAVGSAIRLTGSRHGFMAFLNRERDEFEIIASASDRPGSGALGGAERGSVAFPPEIRELVERGEPIAFDDYPADGCGFPPLAAGVSRRALLMPLRDGGLVTAVAGVADKDEPFDEADEHQFNLLMEGAWNHIKRRREGEELLAAKQAAEEANLAKSQFLANISHELRTPIAGIVGMAGMLESTGLNTSQSEILNLLQQSAGTLRSIIEDILDLSRIEANTLALEAVRFNLRDALQSLVATYDGAVAAKGVQISMGIHPLVPVSLWGDPKRLIQILDNLLSNAMKFTDGGSVRLDVRYADQESGDALLHFSVADSGIGIPHDKQDSLFLRFSQLDSSYAKKFSGTGLGLAICKELVNMMGGSIWVESEAGQGSTFHFTARFEEQGGQEGDDKRDASAPCCRYVGPGKDVFKILLAEDNIVNQKFIAHFLEDAGHSVRIAGNGQEAIDILTQGRESFDLVLMDIQMPQMDGLTATRVIRSTPEAAFDPNIPIIAITAYAMKGDRERFLAAGMNEYLAKPVDFEELEEVMRRVVAGRERMDAGGEERKSAILDRDAGLAMVQGDEAFLRRLVSVYVEDSPRKAAEAVTALEQGDLRAVARLAHSLKSASKIVGAHTCLALATDMEIAANGGDSDKAAALLGRLVEELEVVRAAAG